MAAPFKSNGAASRLHCADLTFEAGALTLAA